MVFKNFVAHNELFQEKIFDEKKWNDKLKSLIIINELFDAQYFDGKEWTQGIHKFGFKKWIGLKTNFPTINDWKRKGEQSPFFFKLIFNHKL